MRGSSRKKKETRRVKQVMSTLRKSERYDRTSDPQLPGSVTGSTLWRGCLVFELLVVVREELSRRNKLEPAAQSTNISASSISGR